MPSDNRQFAFDDLPSLLLDLRQDDTAARLKQNLATAFNWAPRRAPDLSPDPDRMWAAWPKEDPRRELDSKWATLPFLSRVINVEVFKE